MHQTLHAKMSQEMKQKDIFRQARQYAFAYADKAFERPVFPTPEAIAAKLEAVSEAWLKELFGLPEQVVAGFVSGSSLAIVCGLAAARYRIFQNSGWDINQKGFYGAPGSGLLPGDRPMPPSARHFRNDG